MNDDSLFDDDQFVPIERAAYSAEPFNGLAIWQTVVMALILCAAFGVFGA